MLNNGEAAMNPKILQAQIVGNKKPPRVLGLILRCVGGEVTQDRIRDDYYAIKRVRKNMARAAAGAKM